MNKAEIRAAAKQERTLLTEQEYETRASSTLHELRRHQEDLRRIESVYQPRLRVLDNQEARS